MKKYLIALIVLISSSSIFAQEFYLEKPVKIYQDSRIDSLISLHRKINEFNLANELHDGIDGFRVQLFFESGNNSKDKTMNIRDQFLRRYPQIGAYVIYSSPYYRLRVGDFRTEIEAERFLQRIIRRYPAAYVVSTKIRFPELD
jgi:hypothetical protein